MKTVPVLIFYALVALSVNLTAGDFQLYFKLLSPIKSAATQPQPKRVVSGYEDVPTVLLKARQAFPYLSDYQLLKMLYTSGKKIQKGELDGIYEGIYLMSGALHFINALLLAGKDITNPEENREIIALVYPGYPLKISPLIPKQIYESYCPAARNQKRLPNGDFELSAIKDSLILSYKIQDGCLLEKRTVKSVAGATLSIDYSIYCKKYPFPIIDPGRCTAFIHK